MCAERAACIATPSPWIVRWATLVRRGGAVLDVACGSGRHLRYFLGNGHPVIGIDRDVSALADLAGNPAVEVVRADLEDNSPWPFPGRRFAGIVVANYLHRPLFFSLIEALEPGGALLYETFAVGNEKYGKPSNPDFLLRAGELLERTRGLRVIAYEAVEEETPRRAVVQRIAAVKPEE